MTCPIGNQTLKVGKKIAHRIVAALQLRVAQHRLQRPEDGHRPRAQRSALGMGHAQQIADDFNRDG